MHLSVLLSVLLPTAVLSGPLFNNHKPSPWSNLAFHGGPYPATYMVSLTYYPKKNCHGVWPLRNWDAQIPFPENATYDEKDYYMSSHVPDEPSKVCQEWPTFGPCKGFALDVIRGHYDQCVFGAFAKPKCQGNEVETLQVGLGGCMHFKKKPKSYKVECWKMYPEQEEGPKNSTHVEMAGYKRRSSIDHLFIDDGEED